MRETFAEFKAKVEDEHAKQDLAIAEAPKQFEALVRLLAEFNGEDTLGRTFQWQRGRQSLIFENGWAVPIQKGHPGYEIREQKIRFWLVSPPETPDEQPVFETQMEWSLSPEIQDGHFAWRVAEIQLAFTPEELAEEAAKNLVRIHLEHSNTVALRPRFEPI